MYPEKDDVVPLLCHKRWTMYNSMNNKEPNGNEEKEFLDQSIHINRPVYDQDGLNRDTLYEKPTKTIFERLKSKCHIAPITCLTHSIPILKWLPRYKWKKCLFGDIVSGVTVTVMQIPQGMGYALLGGVPPITGIYMAFFPVLIYALFGTSRHTSSGTFAIICLMTGKLVNQYSTHVILQNGTVVEQPDAYHSDHPRTNMQVAMTTTFLVALIQIVMYILRLGIITTLFSETLIKGLTCATSCHVVVSQLKDIFGLKLQKRRGYFTLPLTLYDVGKNLPHSHLPSVLTSLVTLCIFLLNSYLLKPYLAKKTKIPFPIELFIVIAGTTFSYFTLDNPMFQYSVIGKIPTGLPTIQFPDFSLLDELFLDCVVIALVSYAVSMSMALLFAKKLMYQIDSNQELLAYGLSNTVGSFFSCMPTCASVSRSIIQEAVGGCSQVASLVSCTLLLFVLLWLGPVFESLPKCCLGTLIAFAIWPAVMQCTRVWFYWKMNKWDGIVWMVTFSVTLFLQIGLGLGVGVAISVLSILVQGYRPYTCSLGVVPTTDLYLDLDRYKAVQEIDGVKIFHFSGMLNFASKEVFADEFKSKMGFDPAKVLRKLRSISEQDPDLTLTEVENLEVKYVILDFGALTYLDPAGVTLLRTLQKDCEMIGISLYIAGCSGPVFETFIKCDRIEKLKSEFKLFPTIHDAVLFAQNKESLYKLREKLK